MALNIVFDPLVPATIIWVAALFALALGGIALWTGLRGSVFRTATALLILLILSNPALIEEERDPVNDVVALVIDKSQSQKIGERDAMTDAIAGQLTEKLAALKGLDLRTVTVTAASGDRADGTNLVTALESALIDVPAERIGGAILVTDGQVHDVPETPDALSFDAPVHALITGRKDDRDRKLTVVRAPRFGIVGESVTVTVEVTDYGPDSPGRTLVPLEVRVDGEPRLTRRVLTDQPTDIEIELEHGGQNVIEIEVADMPDELTDQNNRAVVLTNGIRDRLRVLLVSGEPHAGERTWRNLLKADPSVDLVHFTILRPPEKQDGTPIGELSLIAFPTRELFSVKLEEFDLTICDRYRRRGVLPQVYLGNVARFVEQGGALLTAAGPAFASPFSLYRSPLAAVLPAQPTGDVVERGFRPDVTKLGARHPVTMALPGSAPTSSDGAPSGDAAWGRWFRLIDSATVSGEVVMSGPDDRPLLVLDRFEEGRVAQLMSDHAWLWDRGFEGGGPQSELLRRLAHWLMKEPDLEQEDLRVSAQAGTLEIRRRSIKDEVGDITVTAPSGRVETLTLDSLSPGLWGASLPTEELGLYRLNDAALTAVAAVGPLNPKEFADVRATEEKLAPLVDAFGGGSFWVADPTDQLFAMGSGISLPDIRHVRSGRDMAGRNWLGLRQNDEYLVLSVTQIPLLTAGLALLLLFAPLLLAWYREGK